MFKIPLIKSVLGAWAVVVCLPGLSLRGCSEDGKSSVATGRFQPCFSQSLPLLSLSVGLFFKVMPLWWFNFILVNLLNTFVKQKLEQLRRSQRFYLNQKIKACFRRREMYRAEKQSTFQVARSQALAQVQESSNPSRNRVLFLSTRVSKPGWHYFQQM